MIFTRTPRNSVLPLALSLALALTACGGDDPAKLMADAKVALAKDDYSAAVIQLKGALQKEPTSSEARFLLGKTLLKLGDSAGAETELQKALDAGYDADAVVPLIAQALTDAGQYKRLEARFAHQKLRSPQAQADLLVAVAASRFGDGQSERAMSALDEALALQPEHAAAKVAKARALASAQRFDDGMALLEQVLAKHPDDADALKLKGDLIAYWKRQPDEALKLYEQAVKARPRFADAQSGVVRILLAQQRFDQAKTELAKLRKLGENRPLTLYLGAQAALMQGKLEEARGFSQKLLKLAPDNGWALELAGMVEMKANALVQAEPYLTRALKSGPEQPLARQMLIQLYLRTGQFEKAAAALPDKLDALQDPDTLGLAGQVYLVQGDQTRAQAMFARAAQLAPNDPEKQTSLALSKLASGKDAEAFGDLRGIAGRDKGVVADMALINALMQRGEFDKAIDATQKLESKKPGDPIPGLIRAQALLGKGDEKGARQVLESVTKSYPKYFPAVGALGNLDAKAGKFQDVQKRIEAFLVQEPKSVDALLSLAQVRQKLGAKPDEMRALFNRAVEAAPEEPLPRLNLIRYQLFVKDNKGALTAAQSALAVLPSNLAIQDALGQAQVAVGEYNQAINTYGKLATMQPGSVVPYMRMAGVHAIANKFDEAAAVLRKALELKPDSLEAQRGLAELALRNNSMADALAMTHNIQKQRPKEPIGFMMEGDVLIFAKKYDEALKAYQLARDRAPNSTGIALKMHGLLIRSGKRADADKFAETWTNAHPKDLAFKGAMGANAISEGNFALAERYFRQVNAAAPDNVVILNNLSWALYKQGNKEALIHVERAVGMAPDNADILDTAAHILAAAGQLPRAQEMARKAMSLQPERHEFKVNLARLQIQAGDKAGAKATLQSVQQVGKAYGGQAEVDAMLRGL